MSLQLAAGIVKPGDLVSVSAISRLSSEEKGLEMTLHLTLRGSVAVIDGSLIVLSTGQHIDLAGADICKIEVLSK